MDERTKIESVEPSNKESIARVKDISSKGMNILDVRSDEPGYVRVEQKGLCAGMIAIGKDRIGRWVNTRQENLTRKEMMGYEVCKDAKVKTMSRHPGGTHKINELIFMTAPREIVEERKKDQKRAGELRRNRYKTEFRESAKRMGVETFEE